MKRQDYIYDFKLYNGEMFDINLSSWRNNSLLFRCNFCNLYSSEYNIEWGKNKWIDIPYDTKWKNIVLITSVPNRLNEFDYNMYISKFPNFKFIFISIEKSHYDLFVKNINVVNVDYFCPLNLLETAIAINSCEFFMGPTSGLLCIAYAMHKKSVTIESPNHMDNLLHSKMHFLNTIYNINEIH